MSVRAKFRCNSVTLMKSSYTNPKYEKVNEEKGWAEAQRQAKEAGDDISLPFDQPTVKLGVVADDSSPENKAFWSATPMGSIEMTISNPDAAEQFELGEFYYVDFAPADA